MKPNPEHYAVADDDPTTFDKRGFRTAVWSRQRERWEMFCPPFDLTCTGDLHVTDVVGMCDCSHAATREQTQ